MFKGPRLSMESTPQKEKQRYREEVIQTVRERYIIPNINREVLLGAISDSAHRYNDGVMFNGMPVYQPEEMNFCALSLLPRELQESITAHGVGVNRPLNTPPNVLRFFSVNALVNILSTGELRGYFAPLMLKKGESSGIPGPYKTADFLLLSNRDEQLAESGVLTNLRTVLVNGKYESIVENFRKAFPWVSFETAQTFNSNIFLKKEKKFHSYVEKAEDEVRRRYPK